ncbi:MAG: DUF1902 domain-containing protein [Lachnospiraceae bacterium]|jgi:hypothetical protein|nr:DUF1902 domain-containing protein [Lachnospiraceae bacterium]
MKKLMVEINIFWDEEASVWVAVSDAIGLALESASYDALIERLRVAAPEMAALNNVECSYIMLSTQKRQVACQNG